MGGDILREGRGSFRPVSRFRSFWSFKSFNISAIIVDNFNFFLKKLYSATHNQQIIERDGGGWHITREGGASFCSVPRFCRFWI